MTSIGGEDEPSAQTGLPLWTPTAGYIKATNLTGFATLVEAHYGAPRLSGSPGENYRDLWTWSVAQPQDFWSAMWEFAQIRGERGDGPVMRAGTRMQDTRWFDGARLNYAENLLQADDDALALCFANE